VEDRRTIEVAADMDRRKLDLNDLHDTPPWDWPANAGEMLMQALPDRSIAASDRILAAQLAGDITVMDDEMADLLLSIVRSADEPEKLRAKAAISLGPVLEEMDTEGFEDDLSEPPITKRTFDQIQETLGKIYSDEDEPKEVRRRVLEAAVRAPQDWQRDAIEAAYSSDDEDWKLTATFCMQWVPGFGDQILEMLESRNPDIHYEAVRAAGAQVLDAAWPHVAALLTSETTEKTLLLAAIEAAASIRPSEAGPILAELASSDDDEIAEAADDAMDMALHGLDEYGDEDEDEDEGEKPLH
jgi:hypothetical protein